MTAIIQIQINGVEQTSSELELGAFNGDMITGAERIGCYGSHGYYRVYLSVYGSSGSYEVMFKLYNHQTEEELDNYVITHQGEPYTFTWVSDTGIGSNKKPIVINFTTGQTFTKEITGYGSGNGNWYLIASPIDDVNPAEIEGMTTGAFDLYWFDQTQDLEWRNYKQGDGFNLVSGMGYLYAKSQDVDLEFTGMPVEGDTYEVSLVKDDDADLSGWNLVGNPFTETAYIDRPFYVMNQTGSEIAASTEPGIAPMEGVFVVATEDGEPLTFSTEAPGKRNQQIVANVTHDRGIAIDRAIIRFGEDRMLPKFQIRDNSSKIYIPICGQDYAVVHSENMGEMPLNFKAEENGTYSINVNAENMEMSYLYLIDNMTSADVDLLETPCYSFEARTTDYASRFKLVFSVYEDKNSDNEAFAFISNGNIIITGVNDDAFIQVIDMMGRIVLVADAKHCISTSGMTSGVYVLRLTNDNEVRTQKIIIE